jgi:hypothetical protein
LRNWIFSFFPLLFSSLLCRLKDIKTIDWSNKWWECVTGSASHHKTNDPGPFHTYTQQKKERECVYVTMNSEHECIYILPLLCLSTISLIFFLFFPLSCVLSCRNLMHTHIPSIENHQWSKWTRFNWEKTIRQIGGFGSFFFPTNFFYFNLKRNDSLWFSALN